VFSYSQSMAAGSAMVDIPVAKSPLTDGNYHSLVVVVTTSRLALYRDGTMVDSRYVSCRDRSIRLWDG